MSMVRLPGNTRRARWLVAALALGMLPLAPVGAGLLDDLAPEGPLAVAREVEPVVLTGADVPEWSRLAAQGLGEPYPKGAPSEGVSNGFPPGGDDVRSAHHGTVVVPPDARSGAAVDRIAAYRWDGEDWTEVPVQVDERYPYFLANARSDFAMYSGTDPHLTYAWQEESWKKVAGDCFARYPTAEEISALVAAGVITPGAGETAEEYVGAKGDPVPTLDDDDELVFMASDAGERAPADADGPAVSDAGTRYEVAVVDPTSGRTSFVYLFQQEGGSSFDTSNGYVSYQRDANSDEYLDRRSFDDADPEKLGTSNTGYGPNLPGTVCRTSPQYQTELGVADLTSRASSDRFPRDGLTVSTDAYRWRATGRWMIRELQVAKPDGSGYGADLVDRWKGRAFQQSPDSSISVVGFEDEQVNWEANSTVLGWKAGPVRAMREVWGADSGTNVTKMETFYRDGVAYRYRVRVHPIPPDGLYTSWDYNAGVAQTYYNALRPEGVPIDGVNDDTGQVDDIGGRPAFFDAPDPTFDLPSAIERWEQVAGAGDNGSLVYIFELVGPSSAVNFAAVPYYRDDMCLDDGTGDNPVARPWPGETSTDARVVAGYGGPNTPCEQRQGAWGAHGLHFFATGDSDNAFTPLPVTEIDGQQWQWAVPLDAPRNVGESYAQVVRAKSKAVAAPQANEPERTGPKPCPPEHANGRGPERCREDA